MNSSLVTRHSPLARQREADLSAGLSRHGNAAAEASREADLSAVASREGGFTLLELMIVLTIIVIMSIVAVPAITSRKSADDVTRVANELKALLDKARAYAQGNNTYVFVGFEEVDASVDPSVSPQVPGNGRTVVAAVATKDGTRHCVYTNTNQGADWTANYNNGANLVAVINPQVFENVHFSVDFASWTPTEHPNSNMARYQNTKDPYNSLGTATTVIVTPFTWPLGTSLDLGTPPYKYRFDKVINFDPRGVARIATQTNADEITDLMEIDLQQARGTVVPPVPTNQDVGNQVVIQIEAPAGAVRIYRP